MRPPLQIVIFNWVIVIALVYLQAGIFVPICALLSMWATLQYWSTITKEQ